MKAKLREWEYVLISFAASLVIMILIAFCYDMIPFGDNTILRMDMYHQYGPLLAELYDRITSGGSLLYSWQSGGGGSFVGNFLNYLSSPISFFVLLFGHKNTTEAIMFIISIKAALSAASFSYYLKESDEFKFNNFATSGFGLLYAFSAYFVAYYWNFMWLDGMVLLPIIILGLERLIDGKSPKTYVISLALLMLATYYMAYMVCIFCVLYAIAYFIGKHPMSKQIFKSAGRFILYSILAAGLMAFTLIPVYFCLKTCSATSDDFPVELSTFFSFFDFLGNHLASLEPTIRSSGDDVLPNVYCGILTLILALLYFYNPEIKLKEKISRILLLGVLYLSMNVNVLHFIWHGFHSPNDLPYRFSFVYCFVLVTLAVKALKEIDKISNKDILTVGIILVIFIAVVEEIGSTKVLPSTSIISIACVVLYTIGLRFYTDKRFPRKAVSALLACFMFAEVAVANTDHYDIDQPKTDYASDYTDYVEIKEALDEKEGNDNYRLEFSDLRTLMNPSWYGYNGLSCFTSMAYERTSNLQKDLGMKSNYINSYTYNPQTPIYNAMFSLKYLINNSEAIDIAPEYWTEVTSKNTFTAYENNYYLPLAYMTSSDINNWCHDLSSPFDVQADYWYRATGLEGVYDDVTILGYEYNNVYDFGDIYDSHTYNVNKEFSEEAGSFTIAYTPNSKEDIFVYVDSNAVDIIEMFSDDDSFFKSATVEDEPYIYELGYHEPGETLYLTVNIKDDYNDYDVEVYIAGLNQEIFEEGYEILSKQPFEITKQTDTKIEGTITATEDGVFYTSINYDDSWSVYVDGNKVETYALADALLAFDLAEGTHTITLKYFPRGLTAGIIISALSLGALISISILKKRKQQNKEETETE